MSEIDDIFSGKAKGKAPISSGKLVSSTNPSPKKDKKKQKKRKKSAPAPDAAAPTDVAPVASSSKKRPAPETFVDTSHHLLAPTKRRKVDSARDDSKTPGNRPKKGVVDSDTLFKDSRGTSERKFLVFAVPPFSDAFIKVGRQRKDGQCIKKTNLV